MSHAPNMLHGEPDVREDEFGELRVRTGRRPPGPVYASPLWPPPGHTDAAHRTECGRDGRGCCCPRDVIPFQPPRQRRAALVHTSRGIR
ncbi:MAG TPA: hypothetical protein VEB22_15315 [Phycisphaerales bacterium]|nr:hypothetical protein [Phycisphaerales bacterium]